MFRLRRESESFLEMAPWKFESRIELDISAEVCFEILMDDRSFIHWHPEITNIKWLIPSSPRTPTTPSPPKTSGSRRTMVYKDWLCYALLAGPVTIEEEYVLVDNENFEIQISFASIGRPTFLMFHAFREQYKVESMGASRCKLIRRIGVEPAFLSRRIFGCITYPTMKKTFEESCPQRLKKALAEKKLPIVT